MVYVGCFQSVKGSKPSRANLADNMSTIAVIIRNLMKVEVDDGDGDDDELDELDELAAGDE